MTISDIEPDTTIQPDTTGDAPDTDQDPIFTPYRVLPHHAPVAMALVNREPFGCKNSSQFPQFQPLLTLRSPKPQQQPNPPKLSLDLSNQPRNPLNPNPNPKPERRTPPRTPAERSPPRRRCHLLSLSRLQRRRRAPPLPEWDERDDRE